MSLLLTPQIILMRTPSLPVLPILLHHNYASSWNISPLEPPDSSTFAKCLNVYPDSNDLYHRRGLGSLPANAFPLDPSQSPPDSFDSLVCHRSIDTSIQRLASNPFASLARAKNGALCGPGFGVSLPGRIPQLNRWNRIERKRGEIEDRLINDLVGRCGIQVMPLYASIICCLGGSTIYH